MAFQRCDDAKRQLDDMTGGTSSLASFMQKVQYERDKTNKKLDNAMKKVEGLEGIVLKDFGATEKTVDHLRLKCSMLEKQVQDIDHE